MSRTGMFLWNHLGVTPTASVFGTVQPGILRALDGNLFSELLQFVYQ